MTVGRVTLREVCRQDRTGVKPGEAADLPYLGLESIESGTGRLATGDLSKTPEAPQAVSFAFGPQHVLYGKLRPYLNKVFLPDSSGKCSTEIIPLLPRANLDRRYLAYFLRARPTVERISAKTAGARMPRADMDFVLGLDLPLPPVDEQRGIVDVLSRAERIVRLRREAQAKAQAVIPALFLDMFGDPATNPSSWPTSRLGEVLRNGPTNGLYKPQSAYGSGTPILRIDGFYDGQVEDLARLKRIRIDCEAELDHFALTTGDIVINRVNSPEYLGKSAIIPRLGEPTVYESNMMRFAVDTRKLLPEFAIALLQQPSSRRHFLARAKHAINQSSINQQDVKSLPVILPPLVMQSRFEQRCRAVQSVITRQDNALAKATAAFDALLARTFA
ncbi:MAG: hypothetical protein FGM40_04500 [Rhodocyclaceae bacterium]|nr:hypothetical protein [Rhodocyclaceae bacterium]